MGAREKTDMASWMGFSSTTSEQIFLLLSRFRMVEMLYRFIS